MSATADPCDRRDVDRPAASAKPGDEGLCLDRRPCQELGEVYHVLIPDAPAPVEYYEDGSEEDFGMLAGGQTEIIARLARGFDEWALEGP